MSDLRHLRGVGVSPGVALAPAIVVQWDIPDVPDRTVSPEEVEHEIARLRAAVAHVTGSVTQLRERVRQRVGIEESGIFDAQILLAQDQDFLDEVELLIRKNQLSAESAFEFKALESRNLWGNSPSQQLRERLTDLKAVQYRILNFLLGNEEDDLWSLTSESHAIVVAHDIAPGLTVQLDRDRIVGLISEEGTRTSHAAILAHSLGIPAVMGVVGALDRIETGTTVLLDGHTGEILLEPTIAEREDVQAMVIRRHRFGFELESHAGQPSITPDGSHISLMGNVDLPEEIEAAQRHGAQGVGLVRTEFLITGRTSLPSEEQQYRYFRRLAAAFRDWPVIIRSFDLGGDKFPPAFQPPEEMNPFLGWRSIRVCLDRPEIFRPQIRAVLRAAVDQDIWLMLPLITSVSEVQASRQLVREEAQNLAREGIRAAESIKVGVMVETPAAVILADRLALVSDFFSVGTNDLTQYTLAVDRGNARLSERFETRHPAILRQLKMVIDTARAHQLPASVCGEMASDPLSAVLLMGLGYTSLSVSPQDLPVINWVVRNVPMAASREAADHALRADSAEEVREALLGVVRDHVDPRFLTPFTMLPGPKTTASLPHIPPPRN